MVGISLGSRGTTASPPPSLILGTIEKSFQEKPAKLLEKKGHSREAVSSVQQAQRSNKEGDRKLPLALKFYQNLSKLVIHIKSAVITS